MNGSEKKITVQHISAQSLLIQLKSSLLDWKKQAVFWPLFLAGFALDLWTKSAVFGLLSQQPGRPVKIIDGFLNLVAVENAGAAFGIASGYTTVLVALSAVALVIIIAFFLFSRLKQKMVNVALALFAAGVCGNLYDRLFNQGRVRDFIDVVYWPNRHWPAFNLADSLLCIAVALVILSGFHSPKQTEPPLV